MKNLHYILNIIFITGVFAVKVKVSVQPGTSFLGDQCALNISRVHSSYLGPNTTNTATCLRCIWKTIDVTNEVGVRAGDGFTEIGREDGMDCRSCNPLCQECLFEFDERREKFDITYEENCRDFCSCLYCDDKLKCLVSKISDGGVPAKRTPLQECEEIAEKASRGELDETQAKFRISMGDKISELAKAKVQNCTQAAIARRRLPRGFYFNISTDPYTSHRCPPQCARCEHVLDGDKVLCLHCVVGYQRIYNAGKKIFNCVEECPPGTGLRILSHRECLPCAGGCELCPFLSYRCRKCHIGYKHYRHVTSSTSPSQKDMSIVECTMDCPSAHYLDGDWCMQCPYGCRSCTQQTKCDRCKDEYNLVQGKCVRYDGSKLLCDWRCASCLPDSPADQRCYKCRYYRIHTGLRVKCLYKCPENFESDSQRYCVPITKQQEQRKPKPFRLSDLQTIRWVSLLFGSIVLALSLIMAIVGILTTKEPAPTMSADSFSPETSDSSETSRESNKSNKSNKSIKGTKTKTN